MATSITGQGIAAYKAPDDALSSESKNAVQNKVIDEELSDVKNAISEIPTFHTQEYVPNPVESVDYDFIVVPNGSNEVYLDEFETLDTAHFDFDATGTATVTASDGYLVLTTVANERGTTGVTYNYAVDITKNTRFSMLFNYVTANSSSFRLFDLGKGNLYAYFNKTNKLRIVCKDPNGDTKYIAADGSVSDSATNFDIAVNTEYVFECIIAENKVKLKIYNPADDSVVLNTTTQLSALISLNENGIRFGKVASTASTAVNYKVGWFQHDEIED